MQAELEVKAIKKRKVDTVVNSTKLYGVSGNQVKGYSSEEGDGYDIHGANSKKGGESKGSLVDHLNQGFDLSTGGNNVDQKERAKQQSYVLPGKITYSEKNYYSDANDIKINTSGNIGQVVIY